MSETIYCNQLYSLLPPVLDENEAALVLIMAATMWDPASTLLSNKGIRDKQCIGYAPSCGRRCRNPISMNNQAKASQALMRLGSLDPKSAQAQRMLSDIASMLLCQRNHQSQIKSAVTGWTDTIDSMPTATENPRAFWNDVPFQTPNNPFAGRPPTTNIFYEAAGQSASFQYFNFSSSFMPRHAPTAPRSTSRSSSQTVGARSHRTTSSTTLWLAGESTPSDSSRGPATPTSSASSAIPGTPVSSLPSAAFTWRPASGASTVWPSQRPYAYNSTTSSTAPTPESPTPVHPTPDPSTLELSTTEPSSPEPSTTEPSTPEPSTPEPSTPEPSTPEPSAPEVSTPELPPEDERRPSSSESASDISSSIQVSTPSSEPSSPDLSPRDNRRSSVQSSIPETPRSPARPTTPPPIPEPVRRPQGCNVRHARRHALPEDCSICHEALELGQSFSWCKAQCGQNFHKDCSDVWLQQSTQCPFW